MTEERKSDSKINAAESSAHPDGSPRAGKSRAVRNWKWEKVFLFSCGALAGAALALLGGFLYLRANLISLYRTDLSYTELSERLPGAVADLETWSMRPVSCALPSPADGARLQNFQLCNAAYAQQLVDASETRKTASLLPCSFALYEDGKGGTVLSRLNVRMLGWILGGDARRILSEKAVPEQELLLKRLKFSHISE